MIIVLPVSSTECVVIDCVWPHYSNSRWSIEIAILVLPERHSDIVSGSIYLDLDERHLSASFW